MSGVGPLKPEILIFKQVFGREAMFRLGEGALLLVVFLAARGRNGADALARQLLNGSDGAKGLGFALPGHDRSIQVELLWAARAEADGIS